MLILSFIFRGLEFLSVNNTSIDENSELKVFKNIKVLVEIYGNWPNNFMGTNVYKTLNHADSYC